MFRLLCGVEASRNAELPECPIITAGRTVDIEPVAPILVGVAFEPWNFPAAAMRIASDGFLAEIYAFFVSGVKTNVDIHLRSERRRLLVC